MDCTQSGRALVLTMRDIRHDLPRLLLRVIPIKPNSGLRLLSMPADVTSNEIKETVVVRDTTGATGPIDGANHFPLLPVCAIAVYLLDLLLCRKSSRPSTDDPGAAVRAGNGLKMVHFDGRSRAICPLESGGVEHGSPYPVATTDETEVRATTAGQGRFLTPQMAPRFRQPLPSRRERGRRQGARAGGNNDHSATHDSGRGGAARRRRGSCSATQKSEFDALLVLHGQTSTVRYSGGGQHILVLIL